MEKYKYILLVVILNVAHARDENRGWMGVFSRKQSENKNYFTHQELQIRYDFNQGQNQQLLARFGILQPLTHTQEIGLLLGYVETGASIEYRPTLQHIYNIKWSNTLVLGLRSRFEWRDWQNSNVNSIRTRFQISVLRPVTNSLSVLVWDEPFVNITNDSMSGRRTFERNRAFVGFRKQFQGHQFEIGYLNQYIPREKDLTEHVAVVYVYF
jgi:hypothetical protein